MGWFNTNKKKDGSKEPNKQKKNVTLDFKVTLWEDVGFSVREVRTFQASRHIDEDKVPFIYNEELKFMELYPQDIRDNVKLDEKEINTKINETEKKLKDIRKKKIEDYKEDEPNTLDLEFLLMKLKAKQRGLKYSKSASYVNFDSKGQVCFNFLRKGNSFFPFKWDTDTETIHTASEPVVKKAGILLRNKENKFLPKRLIETSTLILLAIGIIWTLLLLYASTIFYQKYDDSNLGKIKAEQLKLTNICSKIVIDNAELVTKMGKNFNNLIENKTTTKITGFIPS